MKSSAKKVRQSRSESRARSTQKQETSKHLTNLLKHLVSEPEAFHFGAIRATHSTRRLLLDIDRRYSWRALEKDFMPTLRSRLCSLGIQEERILCERSSSGKWHCIVTLKEPLPHLAILFAQLYCGSDSRRERCNFIRFVHWKRRDRYAQVLFSYKVSLRKGGSMRKQR